MDDLNDKENELEEGVRCNPVFDPCSASMIPLAQVCLLRDKHH
jgi:hypothetical protein